MSTGNPAYTVRERKPGARRSLPNCVLCRKTVEPHAVPLDVRVPALCDNCQREAASAQRS